MHIYIFSAYLQGTSNSYQQNASIPPCFIKKAGTFQLQRGPVNFNFIFVRLNCFFSLTKASPNEQIPIPSPPQSLPPFFFRETRPPDHRIPTHALSILYWPGAKLPFCLRSPGPWLWLTRAGAGAELPGSLSPQNDVDLTSHGLSFWRFNYRLVILGMYLLTGIQCIMCL